MADENRSFRYGDSVFHDGAGPLAKHVPMVFIQGVQARRGGHLGACVQSERLSDEDAAHYAAELGEANRSDNLAKMQAVYMTTALVLVHEGGGFLPHTNESDVKWQLYLVDPEDLRAVEAGSKQAERCARGLRVPKAAGPYTPHVHPVSSQLRPLAWVLRCQTLHHLLKIKKVNVPVKNLNRDVVFPTPQNVMAVDAGLLGLGRRWLKTESDCACRREVGTPAVYVASRIGHGRFPT